MTTVVTAEQALDGIERVFIASAVSLVTYGAPQDGQPAGADRTQNRTFAALPVYLTRAVGSGGSCRRELGYEVAAMYDRTRITRAIMLADVGIWEDLVRHMARELSTLAVSPLPLASLAHPKFESPVRFDYSDSARCSALFRGSIELYVGVA